MAKPEPAFGDFDVRPPKPATWNTSNTMYIAGRAYADEADQTAAQMEAKWGADRLRLLVSLELRHKFDRQRYLYNQALERGEFEDVRRESMRTVKAWLALDKAAEASGHKPLDPNVWEITLPNGMVAAIVPDNHHAGAVIAQERKLAVYTLEEIGRLIAGYPEVVAAKQVSPGTSVTAVRRTVDDPLLSIHDSSEELEPIPF